MGLILASSSPRRRELLSRLGLEFAIISPDIDESRQAGEDLISYVRRLSQEKARAVADAFAGSAALVIGADTIVIDEAGALLGKPADAAEANAMLRHLRGRKHEVVTAFTLLRSKTDSRAITRHERTVVSMREYSDAEISAYVATGDPLDKAGAYAIQNRAFQPVARIEGSYSNVVGLPLGALRVALAESGVSAKLNSLSV